jgi:hypothetical protein
MSENIYKKLQTRLNEYSIGFNATKPDDGKRQFVPEKYRFMRTSLDFENDMAKHICRKAGKNTGFWFRVSGMGIGVET